MHSQPYLRAMLLVGAIVWLCTMPAEAVDPSKQLSQYAHTAWRVQDGVFRGSPFALAQTQDGYLWIGTDSGVVHFDGVTFKPLGGDRDGHLSNTEVTKLLAAGDGSLWIATLGGLNRWQGGQLARYSAGPGGVETVFEDRQRRLWFSRRFADAAGGILCQWADPLPRCLGPEDGVRLGSIVALIEDRQGNLWLGGDTALVRWSPGSHTAYRPRGLESNAGIAGITAVVEASDGTFWIGIAKPGPDLGLQRLVNGRWTPFRTPQLDGTTLSVTSLYLDRDDALWIGTIDRGVYRLHGNVVSHFDRRRGLSGDAVVAITQDREGSVWVATTLGLDRFSDTPVVSFSANEGLCSPEAASVLATRDGSVWTGGDGGLSRLRGGTVSCFRSGRELPGSQVTSLFEDRGGRLWVGLDDGLWIYEHGRFRQVRRPGDRPIGLVTSIAEDTAGQVWIAVSGPPRILMRVDDATVRQEYPEPPLPRRVASDPGGGLWLGLLAGDLAHMRDGTVEVLRFAPGDSGLLHQVAPQRDGSVLAASSFGLLSWRDGRRAVLNGDNGLPCSAVHALAFDDRGDLWLYLSCGLTRVLKADLERWLHDPGARIAPHTFDEFDGVRPGRAAFGAAARSTDGRLWFANGVQLQTVDPARLPRNAIPPPVQIERVVADGVSHSATGILRLPALTRNLQIDYAGMSFVAPLKVQFRHRLDGRDDEWQDAGARRQAFYSDLRPGHYRFRVTASNNDGLWNETGATFDFAIAPAWYQTRWFLVLSLLAGAGAVWAVYQLRLRQVAAALKLRFDERLAERTRVARELHDTLLQTVHGSKLVADRALRDTTDRERLVQALEQLSVWLGQAATEGREALHALRASTTDTNDLAEALRRAINECRRDSSAEATLTVQGPARACHPMVRDEVYRIGYEAIRNACVHSHGSRVEVTLAYGPDLTLRIADNGVGIDAEVLAKGKDGHFGLPGMRERAERIGARLWLESGARAGTTVTLVVPARVAFEAP